LGSQTSHLPKNQYHPHSFDKLKKIEFNPNLRLGY